MCSRNNRAVLHQSRGGLCSWLLRKYQVLLRSLPRLSKVTQRWFLSIVKLWRSSLLPFESEEAFKNALRGCNEATNFEDDWSLTGGRFSVTLQEFCGGLSSVFLGTASVESDFSIVNYVKNDFRSSLADFSLDGILHTKQFRHFIIARLGQIFLRIPVKKSVDIFSYSCYPPSDDIYLEIISSKYQIVFQVIAFESVLASRCLIMNVHIFNLFPLFFPKKNLVANGSQRCHPNVTFPPPDVIHHFHHLLNFAKPNTLLVLTP
ncbi:hypothetical protein PsorP6_008026 [Peronosclerospora sorghi]|uniref:Uncharacterized protein n=1 Tax=Peronosclerospora sorghi TaxID=230839 RepID=A0ACC0WAK5_9STRA|nr:hypothetical protein PsorP6_008026 [Peronosclerospora sorghi]